MAERTFVIEANELQAGDRVIVEIDGREIAVFNVDGDLHALANYCVHQGGPVCEGLLSGTVGVDEELDLVYEKEGEIVSCPWHGWEFEIRSGEHLADPGYRLPTYDVSVEDGEVYLHL
jgi:nitrite reductase/ring-hydroxylating ferredoxin subunit